MNCNYDQINDHEAKMARADCLKLAKYSAKIFHMINENDQLDGWVQAKITKAADYISSVYHYMEYEKEARSMIDKGPKNFEENLQSFIKNNLQSNWTACKADKKE